jgi:hypothetical protein
MLTLCAYFIGKKNCILADQKEAWTGVKTKNNYPFVIHVAATRKSISQFAKVIIT